MYLEDSTPTQTFEVQVWILELFKKFVCVNYVGNLYNLTLINLFLIYILSPVRSTWH